MSKLRIDEKHILDVVESVEHVVIGLQHDIKILKDTEEDVFVRFMSFNRTKNLLKMLATLMQIQRTTLSSGHIINHEYFQTRAAKENQWDVCKIDGHSFFIQCDDDQENEEEQKNCDHIPDVLKIIFAEIIKKHTA